MPSNQSVFGDLSPYTKAATPGSPSQLFIQTAIKNQQVLSGGNGGGSSWECGGIREALPGGASLKVEGARSAHTGCLCDAHCHFWDKCFHFSLLMLRLWRGEMMQSRAGFLVRRDDWAILSREGQTPKGLGPSLTTPLK